MNIAQNQNFLIEFGCIPLYYVTVTYFRYENKSKSFPRVLLCAAIFHIKHIHYTKVRSASEVS